MSCVNSFTTNTGIFTAYPEIVTHCVAEKLCRQKGQILAPFDNKEDVQAALDMFNGNNCMEDNSCDKKPELRNCLYASDVGRTYHVGLNFEKAADGTFIKTFTNGQPWNDKKHGSLYYLNPRQKRPCPLGVLTLFLKH